MVNGIKDFKVCGLHISYFSMAVRVAKSMLKLVGQKLVNIMAMTAITTKTLIQYGMEKSDSGVFY